MHFANAYFISKNKINLCQPLVEKASAMQPETNSTNLTDVLTAARDLKKSSVLLLLLLVSPLWFWATLTDETYTLKAQLVLLQPHISVRGSEMRPFSTIEEYVSSTPLASEIIAKDRLKETRPFNISLDVQKLTLVGSAKDPERLKQKIIDTAINIENELTEVVVEQSTMILNSVEFSKSLFANEEHLGLATVRAKMLIETVKNEKAIGKFYVGEPKGNMRVKLLVAALISTSVVLFGCFVQIVWALQRSNVAKKINKRNIKSETT